MASSAINIKNFHTEIPGGFSQDHTTWLFPVIGSVNSHGKKTEWRVYVKVFRHNPDITLPNVPEDAFCVFEDSYLDNKPLPDDLRGWINVDSKIELGKIKKSVPTIVHKGKNLGKASATNVVCQALRDAYSLHNKQLKKSVSATKLTTAVEKLPPMLAQVFKDQKVPPKVDAQNHVFVQRKYNGVRTVATLDTVKVNGNHVSRVIMYSRRKILYPGFSYIKAELMPVLEMYWGENRQLYLDGEIYLHGVPLQEISGYARKEEQPNDLRVDFMIYDCFVANEPELKFSERKLILDEIFENFELKHCKEVETFEATSKEEIDDLYKVFLEEGFEGAMVRIDSPYRYSFNERHCKDLLKLKPTYDQHYEIVNFTTGEKGKAAGAIMIICKTPEGNEFPVTPAMELPDRMALTKKMSEIEPNGRTHFNNQWLGRMLTVYFDELSKDKVPQRARTKMEIRDLI
ncbi:ATP-dependent DNA ligase [Pacmanvirus A23]|uniref:ATP-dependent DNA ligase n=1 Tax=Pacmanvirus A23 TaxID=1932881 RepID=UPI000A092FB9|nr:ATP-dependent DNA ligase [Pacmanvirus A23]SIP85992.1 ATP-dependent DNA ligase [Pacmanvirus A23]